MTTTRWLLIGLTCCVIGGGSGGALAVEDVELHDAGDAPRLHKLSNMLRCMVCQNQSIADSNAPLARDLRNQVKEQLNAGQGDDEIIGYMVQRYGDYVVYRPPFNVATALLWLGPLLLLVAGFVTLWRVLRQRQKNDAGKTPATADTEQRARLRAMLQDQKNQDGSP